MKKSELRQIIRESIRETINEGAMDSFVKMFDNLDVWADKVQAKHPDAIEKTKEALKQTGGVIGKELKQKGLEGYNLLKDKNTPERREKIINWIKANPGNIVKGGAIMIMQNYVSDIIEAIPLVGWDGYMMEFIALFISWLLVGVIADRLSKANPFSKNKNENTETEEIDFNMSLDLTGLLDSKE